MVTKNNEEQIFIYIDNERIELTGEALDAFLEQRAKDQAEYEAADAAMQAEQDAKAAAKESAKAKLAALGLTEVEILALVGE